MEVWRRSAVRNFYGFHHQGAKSTKDGESRGNGRRSEEGTCRAAGVIAMDV